MTLTNYTCKHNDFGICLHRSSGGLYPSPSSLATVTDNICSKNRIGIYLESSSLATVTDNTCKNNGDGIYLVSSSHVMVTDNICGNNTYSGIFLGSSSHAMLTDNACNNNKFYGIKLRSDSDYCIIHHNIFRDNNLEGTSQACDGGKNNTWYEEETQEGNCWSDWKSKKPYPIDGDANATDPYPLNKNLERIDYEYTLIIPALILLTILPRIKRKEKSKIYY